MHPLIWYGGVTQFRHRSQIVKSRERRTVYSQILAFLRAAFAAASYSRLVGCLPVFILGGSRGRGSVSHPRWRAFWDGGGGFVRPNWRAVSGSSNLVWRFRSTSKMVIVVSGRFGRFCLLFGGAVAVLPPLRRGVLVDSCPSLSVFVIKYPRLKSAHPNLPAEATGL